MARAEDRRLRMRLIGGGGAGFIGRVHVTAATLDRRAELVAGALSSNPERAHAAGREFGLADERAYSSWRNLLCREAERPDGDCIDFVSIATPNHTHFEIARAALDAGFNVVCDKPMTTSLREAQELARLVEKTGAVFAVMHNYAGYPLVRQARDMIAMGEIGDVQAVRVDYIQGGLRGRTPGVTPQRGAWKQDPATNGPLGTMSDIGTHAYHLARFTTCLKPLRLSCHLASFAPQNRLDDYGHALVKFENEAVGLITVSQVTHGRLNDLSIEIDGSTGSLSWRQEDANHLILRRFGQPTQTYDRHPTADYSTAGARSACRLPAGHPEAFFEAFANIYRSSFDHMIARANGELVDMAGTDYPTVYAGVEGAAFIEQCCASSDQDGSWVPLTTAPSPVM